MGLRIDGEAESGDSNLEENCKSGSEPSRGPKPSRVDSRDPSYVVSKQNNPCEEMPLTTVLKVSE